MMSPDDKIETTHTGGPMKQSDKQENCYGEPVGERQNDVHMLAALDRIKDWCRCGGNGFWYEQIDGPDNMRKVKCERHEESNQSE